MKLGEREFSMMRKIVWERVNWVLANSIQKIIRNIPSQQEPQQEPQQFPILSWSSRANTYPQEWVSSKSPSWKGQQRCGSSHHGDGVIIELSETMQLHSGQLLVSTGACLHRQGGHGRVNALFQKLNPVSHILTLLYLKINDMRGDDLPPAQIASLAKLQGEEGKEKQIENK